MENNSGITRQTRDEGFQYALPLIATIQAAVLAILRNHPEGLLAEELPAVTGYSLNNVRSRLTELKKIGRVIVVGKRKSPRTGINVAVWKVA